MMDEKILVTRSSMPPMEEYINEIKELWDTHWLTNMGPKHKLLVSKLKEYLQVEQLDLLVNGHMALELAIQAFEFPEGSEIITTPFTFASTTHAIVRNRLIPVFCDINNSDYTIDATKIECLITEKTVAILPVHVYGNVCDVEKIEQIAKKYNLKVIYDAAHSFGEIYNGQGVGSFGDVSVFSFHATKVFNSIEGGAVCFHDEVYGHKLYNLKNFGIKGENIVEAIGANAKMNEFCAAMGLCNLRHLEEEIAKRENVFKTYRRELEHVKGITIPVVSEGTVANYAYYPIIIDQNIFGKSRDAVYDALRKKNIYSRKYFYPLTCDFECYQDSYCIQNPENISTAIQISENILSLPIYADLSEEQVMRVCDEIKKCYFK